MKWVQPSVVSDLDGEPGRIDMDTEYWCYRGVGTSSVFKDRLIHIQINQCLRKLCMHEIVCKHSRLAPHVL